MNNPGFHFAADGVRFTVRSQTAETLWLCLFDDTGERETARIVMPRVDADSFSVVAPGIAPGTRYGLRADGPWDPDRGSWFDPDKLLMDPYATRIDRPWRQDPRLAAPRGSGVDTAPLVPKAIVEQLRPVSAQPVSFRDGGLIYEANVRGFSMLHPQVSAADRGTLAAFRHPAVIAHLKKLRVSAVEFMPVAAWIDERHLPELGLTNVWGYNPVTFMAMDPRLAPRGIADLRDTVAALREENIGVILDIVVNHTGESDRLGPTLSLRGLDNPEYYRHRTDNQGELVNDTGCGNTIACDAPAAREMIIDCLHHFVLNAGVDGFRFDLAPVLGRGMDGFDAHAATLEAIARDAVLSDRVLIAEPWDIGPGGYQLGRFPGRFLEWNDRYRDDVRRYWRGDAGLAPDLATRLAGSSDIFSGERTRSVNFIACHDGFTLADLVAYKTKHNQANREDNRDGHNENFSWNNGIEGEANNAAIAAARHADLRALMATLFVSRGTIMITAGDEFGRSQCGNNNAYAQDNEITWLDWENRDEALEDWVAHLADLRDALPALTRTRFFSGAGDDVPDVEWLGPDGLPLSPREWRRPDLDRLQFVVATGIEKEPRMAILFNRAGDAAGFDLPAREGYEWLFEGAPAAAPGVKGRSVAMALEISRDE